MKNLNQRISAAIVHFWRTRLRQGERQGGTSGVKDAGNRSAVTGGKQLDGFNLLVGKLLVEAGIPSEMIHLVGRENITLPGYFRPTKLWDLLVIANGNLLAAFEMKSLCGPSFGNNYNNRVEEALGSSADIWTAYREGAFATSPEPFTGYLLLLEESDASVRPVKVHETHFKVFDEFRDASYLGRCENTVRRLVRERCYTAACFLTSNQNSGPKGGYREPADDLTFERFVTMMCGHVKANYDSIVKTGRKKRT